MTLRSARRYAKGGAVQKVLSRLPPALREFGQQAQLEMEDILAGRRALPPPSLEGLPVVSVLQ